MMGIPVSQLPAKVRRELGPRQGKPLVTLEYKFLTRWQRFVIERRKIGLMLDIACAPQRQFVFAPPRKLTVDAAWSEKKIAVEIDGGQFMRKSGHSNIKGLNRDAEKSRLLAAMGWRLLRFTTDDVEKERGFEQLAICLRA